MTEPTEHELMDELIDMLEEAYINQLQINQDFIDALDEE